LDQDCNDFRYGPGQDGSLACIFARICGAPQTESLPIACYQTQISDTASLFDIMDIAGVREFPVHQIQNSGTVIYGKKSFYCKIRQIKHYRNIGFNFSVNLI
jgi:hypothetical protein